LVLLPDTAPDTAREVADRLRDATSRLRCARRDESDDAITVTVSIAVSSSPHDGETVDLLLTAADRTLARAKREGRDRVVVAQDDGTASAPAGLDFGAFVSREDEVRVLVAQLELAARDNARVVCLTGEEGIGKTALVRQLEPEVGRRDGTVLHVQSLLGDHGSPYGVWSDVIARLHSLELLVERDWKALPRLVPSIGPSRDGDDWALTPSLLREEIVRAVRRAARDRLLVLVFEDMHWADHASWEVMDALLAAVDRERLLVVITARSQESGATEQALGRITRHPRVSHIALQRFSIAEVRRWTQALMGDADPGDELPRFLHSYTEGVPLFMVHVLHALAAAGDLWLDDTRWEWRPVRDLTLPPGVGFVLERRLERLSPGTRDILAIAAVLGNSFPVDLLVAASALPEDEVRTALHDAALAGVVQPSADGREGSATFAHDVLADACRRTLVERQRQGIHEVCARLLELRAPSDVVAITSHYHAAGLDGEAYRFAVSAADRASAVFSHDTEIAALQVAQRHTPSPRDLALLRARLARTTHTAGRHVSAEEFCDLALEGLDSEADASAVAAVRRLRERVRVQRGGSPQRALHALHLLCTGDPSEVSGAERATSFLVAAELRASMADWSLAATLVRRSLEVAGDAAEADFRGNAARVLGISRYPSVPMEGLALLHESVARLGASTDRAGEARARLALGDLYVRGGHVTHAEEALADALDLARGVHSASIVALISRSLAELHGRRGDFEQASRWMRDAERLFASLGDRPERLRTIVSAAHIARDHGDRARAHALYESACDTARALEVPWIELTALAGSALTNGGPDASSARERWQRASELLAGVRADWWFPGRELLDALSLQMALAAGHSGVAFETFTRASHLLERVEPYAAAWLVAECGEELERAGLPAIGETRRLAAQRAAVLHFAPLIPRLGSA
ncbi:MAG: AAA family ATPase, partial [Gemmatimonadaceae bacterium]